MLFTILFLLPYSILLSTNCAISSIICTELGNVSKSPLIASVTTVHGLDIQRGIIEPVHEISNNVAF